MLCKTGYGQTTSSSLILEFDNTTSIYDKAILASEISWSLKDINPDSSFYYAQMALDYARASNQPKIEAYSLSDIGNYYKRKEAYSQALEYYFKSLEIRRTLDNVEDLASGYNQIGLLYKQHERYDLAVYYFQEGLKTLGKNDYTGLRVKLTNGYAMALFHKGESEKAVTYLDSVYAIAQQMGDTLTSAELSQNKGAVNQYLGNYHLALKFYNKAQDYYKALGNSKGVLDIEINLATIHLLQGNVEMAEKLLLDAEVLSNSIGFYDNLSSVYMDLAEVYKSLDNSKAILYFEKAYKYALKLNKKRLQIESGISLAKMEIIRGNLDRAETLIEEIKPLVEGEKSIVHTIEFYQLQSLYWRKKGRFKDALHYSEKSTKLKDSMDTELRGIQNLSAQLEVSRQEKKAVQEELKREKLEKKEAVLRNNFNRLILWVLGIIITFLVFVIWMINKRNKDRAKIAIIQAEKEQQKKHFELEIQLMSYEADMHYLENRLKLEEDIRTKIGQDLHDQLASKLAVIQIILESILHGEFEPLLWKKELKKAVKNVEESCEDLRHISRDLINKRVILNSLNENFSERCKTISKNGKLNITFSAIGDPYGIPLQIKRNLLATVELLIDNILRHANATKATLQFFYHPEAINIELEDNGDGFDISKIKPNGVGLKNAQNRIQKINGVLDIHSVKNQGTSISISIPNNHD